MIINSFIKENQNLKLVDFYIDDGYLGTNFNRPEFIKMITDITDSKINAIIVKDLSRFGRNHIASNDYIENFLPEYNVRVVSIIDSIDTLKNSKLSTRIFVPLKNLINDCYSMDISEKIKSTLKVKQINGEFIGTFAPYGYKKDEFDKHKLVIDDEVSHIVKKFLIC